MVRGTLLIAALIVVISVGVATAKGHRAHGTYFDPVTGRVSEQNGGGADRTPFYLGESDTRMDVGKSLEHALEGTGVALLFAGVALGASFVGAEFNVGSLTTQLLFEPRRWRVHSAKAAAVAIGAALFAIAVMLLVAVSMYVGSAAHGVVQGVDGTFVAHRVGEALRIAAAVAAAATMAYCVTLVAKRSSAGIVAFFVQYPLLFLLDLLAAPGIAGRRGRSRDRDRRERTRDPHHGRRSGAHRVFGRDPRRSVRSLVRASRSALIAAPTGTVGSDGRARRRRRGGGGARGNCGRDYRRGAGAAGRLCRQGTLSA